MTAGAGLSSRLDRRVRIERPQADNSFACAGSDDWLPVDEVAAEVRDALPSRGERLADGINVATRPARLRIRHRPDVTAAMRFLLLRWQDDAWIVERVMQITAGPATVGTRKWSEFMVEDYSTAGGGA